MKVLFKPVMVLLVLVLSLFISLSTFQLPTPKPIDANQELFSAERAMLHVEGIASVIHPIGSPEQEASRRYILKELSTMGLKPELLTGQVKNDAHFTTGLVPYSGEAQNIYVRLEGSDQTHKAILMLAHYDSTLTGPGAADDASGVSALLEAARALKSGTQLKNDVIILFTDGEEAELLGSKLFVDNSADLEDVCLVINFEAMGNKGPSILFETSEHNAWLIKEFNKAVPYPVAYSLTNEIYKITSNITDFMPFKEAGKSGLNFTILGGTETYHNPQDNPQNLSKASLQHQGSNALALAKHFGNIQLDHVKGSDNAVYFTLMKSVMVSYSGKLVLPLTILALVLFLATVTIGCRKQLLQFKGVIFGFLVSLLTLLITAGIAIAVQTIFIKLYYQIDNIQSTSDLISIRRAVFLNGDKWMPVSMVLTILIIFILQRFYRRKITTCNLFFGSIVTWLILSVLTAFSFQGVGYIFLWPLIFSLIGFILEFLVGRFVGQKFLILFILCTLSCILLYVPIAYALFEALSMTAAGISITLLSLPASLIIMTASLFICNNKAIEDVTKITL